MTIVEVVHELKRAFGTDVELRILPGKAGGVVLRVVKQDKGFVRLVEKVIPPERVVFGGEDTFRYAVGEMIKSLKEMGKE